MEVLHGELRSDQVLCYCGHADKKWKYHGKMSHKAREKSISEFGTDPETKILVASLKCGGTGRKRLSSHKDPRS